MSQEDRNHHENGSEQPGSNGEPDRMAEPIDTEQPPRLAFPVVGVGASAGGLEAYTEFLQAMPSDSGMAIVLIQHLSPKHESMVAEILARHTEMPVHQVEDGMPVEPDHVYVIRPGSTMTLKQGRLHLGDSLLQPGHRRPVDDFFRSLAEEQRERAIAVILSGMGSNGSAGAQAIKAVGGICIAQDPESAKFPGMPRALIDTGNADFILRARDIPEVLVRYASHPYASGDRGGKLDDGKRRESQALDEILAILRARTRNDFRGYKKPTVLRRVERRMGLNQVTALVDYARLLRQNPTEVTQLSDDLLIHVTGFFRDSDAWESLRERVIVPMVAQREDESSIRCWVSACSSGEEAYSLGMLLLEAAEAVGKRFDIKIFATDMAERSLNHARAGAYPGGIESEIPPQRLERFFEKDDAFYHVKQELRELVVFAPQNILQDPPFSRLDIVTCRNLLIYLEPELQQRVIALLHFGLREGGALFLGNSETVSGHEELFEPVDKHWRIYRRIGATRHGLMSFPLPRAFINRGTAKGEEAGVVSPSSDPRATSRLTIPQVANRVLLERFTPAAVVVDRQGRIVYYHGNTEPFLTQPRGEPTRELLALAREHVRGAIRVAFSRSLDSGAEAISRDGTIDTKAGRRRVEVVAAPMDARQGSQYFIVSFVDHPEPEPIAAPQGEPVGDRNQWLEEELHRVRDELQSTIEELQTSNEEMKASHEEITSVNEELQSTNEELETSKEELQSLNEELTTVNAQLQAKMEEAERTGNDLSSLLSSTDIAVIFLDTKLRIRRFTPAVRDLLDLIISDVGRPLSDLHRKFEDPRLLEDCRAVLEKLIPMQAEVHVTEAEGQSERWYQRRITPYRTVDNRIDGVVVTFVDISDRKKSEAALTESEEIRRLAIESGRMGTWRWDCRNRQCWGDAEFLRLWGMQPTDEKIPLESFTSRMAPEGVQAVEQVVSNEIVAGEEFDGQIEVVSGPTAGKWIRWRGRAERGTPWILSGVSFDVTEQRAADQTLRRSEERQAFLLKLTDALRPLSDPDEVKAAASRVLGQHLNVNRAFYAEVDGDDWVVARGFEQDVTPLPDGRYSSHTYGRWVMQTYRAGRRIVFYDTGTDPHFSPPERAAHESVQIRSAIGVPLVKSGKLEAIFVVHGADARQWTDNEIALVEDVADRTWWAVERARIESVVRESEEKYKALFNSMDEAYAVVEPLRDAKTGEWCDFQFIEVNPAFVQHTGMQHPVGRTATQLLGKPNPRWAQMYGRVLETGEPLRVQEDEPTLSRRFDLYIFRLGRDHSRRVAVLFTNITERQRIEEEMRGNDARQKAMFADAAVGLSEISADGRFIRVNQTLCKMLGRSCEELLAMKAIDVTHPDDREATLAALAQVFQTGQQVAIDKRYLRPDGEVIYANSAVSRIPGSNGHGPSALAVTVNLNTRHQVEAALRESEERFRLFADGARDFAMILFDESARITAWNIGAQRLLGWTESEVVGKTGDFIFTPEDRATRQPQHEVDTARRESRAMDERWHLKKDGSKFWGSGVMTALYHDDGSIKGLVKVLRDETGRKEAQDALEAARDAAEAANRAKDEFLAVISHEVRTPLSSILIWSKLLSNPDLSPKELAEGVEAIRKSAESQKQLIDDLLDSSRIARGEIRIDLRDVDLREVVHDATLAIVPTAQTRQITIDTHLPAGGVHVSADADRLRQVVWNLLTNAVKFTQPGGRVDVSIQERERQVELRVSDNGQGINPEFLPRLFDPFTQDDAVATRTTGGLGLGLSIVKKLVELHGGTISAHSEGSGKGATFTVLLPIATGRKLRRPPVSQAASHPLARLDGVTILVVEDQPESLGAIATVLKKQGATVREATHAAQALSMLQQERPTILLSDIGMPEMDGYELIGLVRERERTAGQARLPAIALTAFTREEDQRRALERGFDAFLPKPFTPQDVVQLIRATLEGVG